MSCHFQCFIERCIYLFVFMITFLEVGGVKVLRFLPHITKSINSFLHKNLNDDLHSIFTKFNLCFNAFQDFAAVAAEY